MPDPRKLKVGDRIKFVSLPDEWTAPGCVVSKKSIAFMKAMIARKWPSRICKITEDGYPWIEARMKEGDCTVYHGWRIYEKTGWRLVRKRL